MKTKTLLTAIIMISATLLFAQPDLPFTVYENNPVLEHGESGSWDEGHILWSYVFYEDNTYYLYYSSSTNIWSQPVSIGLAISEDGFDFEKADGPIFEPDGTGFDILKQLKSYDFHIIFITAHDQYALEAFKR